MSHEIENVNGQDRVFSAGELPWHRLGINVEREVSSEAALRLAGGALAGKSRADNVRHELARLFWSGKGNDVDGVRHTRWAAWNAVTEYADHYRINTDCDSYNESNAMNNKLWGSGQSLKQQALDLLVSA